MMQSYFLKPSKIKLSARIPDFTFKEAPQDVFRRYLKRSLVSKYRYLNNSPNTITQSLKENVTTKESITFSFTESIYR